MIASRIPGFVNKSRAGMFRWFEEMSLRGLLFHPEDRPEDIIDMATGDSLFSEQECVRLNIILSEMFGCFGNDVSETACPIFMKAAGFSRANQ